MKMLIVFVAAFAIATATAAAAVQSSISRITFGPQNVLFAADWKAGRVFAYALPDAPKETGQPFNLLKLQPSLEGVLGGHTFAIRDLAMRPGTSEAYISLEGGANHRPFIVRVTPSGKVSKLDLAGTTSTSVALEKTGGTLKFWDGVPETVYTVTDMKWHNGKLYVAGLANQSFSSTLRMMSYPFGRQSMASVEMYHTVHNQIETRAPIRAMAFSNVNGVDTLLAGYLCAPLVSIDVARLVDGAHVKAKTLAELGVAGIPSSMTVYEQPDMQGGKSRPFVLVTERYRPSVTIPLAGIAKEAAGAGLTTPPSFIAPPGQNLGAIIEGFDGVLAIDNQNAKFFIALRRDLETGWAQLVSIDKSSAFRLSDADVSDYDFPSYSYGAKFQQQIILPMQNKLKKEEGYPNLVVTPPPSK